MKKNEYLMLIAVSLSGLLFSCQSAPSGGSGKRTSGAATPAEESKQPKVVTPQDGSDKDVVVLDDSKVDETIIPKPEADTGCYKAEQAICDLEKQVFLLTNELRKQEGKSPLKLSSELSWTARSWSVQMGKTGFISHIGFPGQRRNVYQQEFGTAANLTAENVAMNSTDAASVADKFFRMWESSRGHRVNMLSNAGSIGVGLAKNSRGAWYATQIFGR